MEFTSSNLFLVIVTLLALITIDCSETELIKVSNAIAKGAVCLDGSSPAYQFGQGSDGGSDKWLLHIQGGGWCSTYEDCQKRANSSLGSSGKMEGESFTGILSSNPDLNPGFYNWNRVFVRYCDGSSFTGDQEKPDRELFYRGAVIWNVTMEELLGKGLCNASEALLSGCSAGALTTIIHCDSFRDMLSPSTKVKCLSDAGFFIHVKNAFGNFFFDDYYRQVVELHGSAKHLPSWCTAKMDAGMCFYPENMIPGISTPLFLLNSAYDSWQIGNILVPNDYNDPRFKSWEICKYNISLCTPDQVKGWEYFRSEFLKTFNGLGESSSRGYFINSCHTHCQSEFQKKWLGDANSTLNNMTISQAVNDWFDDQKSIQVIDYDHCYPQDCVLDPSEPSICNGYQWGKGCSK